MLSQLQQNDRFIPSRSFQAFGSYSKQNIDSRYNNYLKQYLCPSSRVLSFQNQNINKQNHNGNTIINNNKLNDRSLNKSLCDQTNMFLSWSNRKASYTKISLATQPQKVLDVPGTKDDFYLNTLDWSPKGPLGIGLDNQAYIYTPNNIVQLCKVLDDSYVSSLKFCQSIVSVGFSNGKIKLYDMQTNSLVREIIQHSKRVSAIAFSDKNIMYTGSKDKNILVNDIRIKDATVNRLISHRGQICSLKCEPQINNFLASGSNDNRVIIWDLRRHQLIRKYREHKGAVKAIDWCPWKSGVIASAGGAGDRTIRVWNVNDGEQLTSKKADSQISSLIWNQDTNLLISSHGHPNNQINFWRPQFTNNKNLSLSNIKTLKGHKGRILSLVKSPSNNMICSLSSDQTLRFWRFSCSNEDPWKQQQKHKISRWSIKLK